MRLLLDSCLSPGVVNRLIQAQHDVVWVGERETDPGDEEILAEAFADARIVVTLDKDFGELAIVFGRPHAGIIRLANLRVDRHADLVQQVLAAHGDKLSSGAIITVEPHRIRIRLGAPDSGAS